MLLRVNVFSEKENDFQKRSFSSKLNEVVPF